MGYHFLLYSFTSHSWYLLPELKHLCSEVTSVYSCINSDSNGHFLGYRILFSKMGSILENFLRDHHEHEALRYKVKISPKLPSKSTKDYMLQRDEDPSQYCLSKLLSIPMNELWTVLFDCNLARKKGEKILLFSKRSKILLQRTDLPKLFLSIKKEITYGVTQNFPTLVNIHLTQGIWTIILKLKENSLRKNEKRKFLMRLCWRTKSRISRNNDWLWRTVKKICQDWIRRKVWNLFKSIKTLLNTTSLFREELIAFSQKTGTLSVHTGMLEIFSETNGILIGKAWRESGVCTSKDRSQNIYCYLTVSFLLWEHLTNI